MVSGIKMCTGEKIWKKFEKKKILKDLLIKPLIKNWYDSNSNLRRLFCQECVDWLEKKEIELGKKIQKERSKEPYLGQDCQGEIRRQ